MDDKLAILPPRLPKVEIQPDLVLGREIDGWRNTVVATPSVAWRITDDANIAGLRIHTADYSLFSACLSHLWMCSFCGRVEHIDQLMNYFLDRQANEADAAMMRRMIEPIQQAAVGSLRLYRLVGQAKRLNLEIKDEVILAAYKAEIDAHGIDEFRAPIPWKPGDNRFA